MLDSANASPSLARQCVAAYLRELDYDQETACALWLAYMARRWEELDQVRGIDAADPTSGGGILIAPTERITALLGT